MSDKIHLQYNPKNFTIKESEARKVMPDIKAGEYLLLGKVFSVELQSYVDARLHVIPDEGWTN